MKDFKFCPGGGHFVCETPTGANHPQKDNYAPIIYRNWINLKNMNLKIMNFNSINFCHSLFDGLFSSNYVQ